MRGFKNIIAGLFLTFSLIVVINLLVNAIGKPDTYSTPDSQSNPKVKAAAVTYEMAPPPQSTYSSPATPVVINNSLYTNRDLLTGFLAWRDTPPDQIKKVDIIPDTYFKEDAQFLKRLNVSENGLIEGKLHIGDSLRVEEESTFEDKVTIDHAEVEINGVRYFFPDEQARQEDYVLSNDGKGVLTWRREEDTFVGITGTPGRVARFNAAGDNVEDSSLDDSYSGIAVTIDGAGQVGIGSVAPSSLLSVGAGNEFQVNAAGNIINVGGGAHSIVNNAGDLAINSNGDLIFDDLVQTTPIAFSDDDDGLVTPTQAIVDAINEAYTAAIGGGGGLWTLTGNTIHPTSALQDFAIGGPTLANSIFSIDEDTGTFLFGGDQSTNPTFTFEATDSDTGNFGFNTNDSFYFSGARVGIGTTGPGFPLDVVGGIRTSDDFYVNAIGLNDVGVSRTTSGASLVGTFDEFSNSSSTNVQDVLDDLDASITVFSSGAGDIESVGSMDAGATFGDATADDEWLGLGAAAGRIEFDDQATDEVNILDANVGIGTQTPATTLDVNGTFQASGTGLFGGQLTLNSVPATVNNDQVLTVNAGVVSSIDTSGWDTDASDDFSGITGTDNRLARFTATNSVENSSIDDLLATGVALTIGATGNVGIGTGAPTSLLSVGATNQFQVNAGGNIVNIGGAAHSITNSGGNLFIASVADLQFMDSTLLLPVQLADVDNSLPNGNVGIVDAINDAYNAAIGGGGGLWSLTGNVINPTVATQDFAIGGSTLAASIFSIDESAGTFLLGGDQSANPTLIFEATDNDTGDFGFNTNDHFYFTGATVGIGTTAAITGSALDINGQVRISGGAPGTGKFLTSDANGLATWVALGSGGVGVNSVNGTPFEITASPVTGNVILSIPTDFRAPGTVNAVNGLYTGAGAGTQKIDSVGNLTNIGTIDMIGGITMTGSGVGISFNGTGNHDITAGAGNLRIGAATLLGALIPGTNDSFDLGSDAGRFNDIYMGATGAFHIGTSTSDEYTVAYDTATNRLGFNVNGTGSPEVIFDSAGNVGIGTTNPGPLFNVGNNNQFQVNSTGNLVKLNGVTTSFPAVQGAAGSVLTNNGSGTLSWASPSGIGVSGYWQRNGTSLAPANIGDDLGIGTITPNVVGGGGKLEVLNTTAGTNDPVTILNLSRRSSGTAANGLAARLEYNLQDSAGNLQEASTINTVLTDVTAGSIDSAFTFNNRIDSSAFQERMRISANGNVGIGTTGPGAPLEVNGQVTAPNNGLFVTTDTYTSGSAGSVIRLGHGAASGNTYGVLDSLTTGGNIYGNLVLQQGAAGNVGVGNIAPGQKVDVTGNIRSSGQLMSTVATGTAPLSVASTTLNANLNADMLDGSNKDTAFNSFGNNTIPVRAAAGYLYSNYFNTTADVTATVASHFAIQNAGDNFIRWQTPANARTSLGLGTGGAGDIWVDEAGDTMTGDLVINGGNLSLGNGTSNIIDWSGFGAGAPTFTTRSAGTKLVLFPNLGAASVDYALGIQSSSMWFSVPTTAQAFRFYGGTTETAVLTGAGALSLDSSVTASDFICTDCIDAANIATGAVTTTEILDNTIIAGDIAPDAIGASEIATGAVGTLEIADNTVSSTDILNATILTGDIAADTILAGNIAAGAVGASEIATDAVGTAEIDDETVSSSDILNGTISTVDIGTDTILAADIAADAVGDSELFNGGTWNLISSLTFAGANVGVGLAGSAKFTAFASGAGVDALAATASGTGTAVTALTTTGLAGDFEATTTGAGMFISTASGLPLNASMTTAAATVARFTNGTTNCTVTPGGGGFTCPSDLRLKKDISTLSDSLDKVLALRGVNYRWKTDSESEPLELGFIAQEVEKVVPELVYKDPETGMRSMAYGNLTPLLVNAMQEQQDQIDDLKNVDLSFNKSGDLLLSGTTAGITAVKKDVATIKTEQEAIKVEQTAQKATLAEIVTKLLRLDALEKGLASLTTKVDQLATKLNKWDDVMEWAKSTGDSLATLIFKVPTKFADLAIFDAPIQVNADTSETVEIPAGTLKAKITFTKTFPGTPTIYLNFVDSVQVAHKITDVSPDGFTISFDKAPTEAFKIQWLAILRDKSKESPSVEIIKSDDDSNESHDKPKKPVKESTPSTESDSDSDSSGIVSTPTLPVVVPEATPSITVAPAKITTPTVAPTPAPVHNAPSDESDSSGISSTSSNTEYSGIEIGGVSIISKGKTSVEVQTSELTTSSIIKVTSVDGTPVKTERTAPNKFQIKIDKALDHEITVNWQIKSS